MARPNKEGLDYFPLDTDMSQDDKVYFIEAKYGLIGFALVVKLLMRIYSNGYQCKWGDKEALIFSKQTSADINVINNLVNDCINEGLFNKNMYESYGILTSKGIQNRYFEAASRRKFVYLDIQHSLIDVKKYQNIANEINNPINVDNNSDNVSGKPTKESKVKNVNIGGEKPSTPDLKKFIPPTLEELKTYCIERKNNIDCEYFLDFYSSKGWMIGKNKMKDWKAAIRTFEKRNKEFNKQQEQSNHYPASNVITAPDWFKKANG